MNANDLHDLDVRINDAGTALSAVDGALAAYRATGGNDPAVLRAHAALAIAGAGLAAVQAWSTDQRKKLAPTDFTPAASSLPAGMVVVSVGSTLDQGAYSGPVDPATLSAANYAWMEQNFPTNKFGQVFSGPPSYKAPDGHSYTVGELATIIRAHQDTPQIPGGPNLLSVLGALPA